MPSSRAFAAVLALAVVLALAAPSGAEEATVTVVPDRFEVKLEVEGRLAPRDAVEVAYDGEVYRGTLEVVEATGPRRVREGEVLVRFEDEDARRALAEAERELEAARIRLVKLEAETRHDDAARERKLARLEEIARRAEADLARWREVDRPLRVEQAEFNLEGSEHRLQDEIEELEQLEKMYKADDLTEETEEIVIRRARRGLERMRRSVEFARKRHQDLMQVDLPREDDDRERVVADRKGDLEAYRTAVRAERALAEIALVRAREAFSRQEERLAELRRDIDRLRLRAPAEGFAVPGRFHDGNWTSLEDARRMLAAGEEVKHGQTLYTIVTPGNVKLLATVSEKDVRGLEGGQGVTVRPVALDGRVFEAVVAEVWPLPHKGRCPLEIALRESDAALMPGGAAKAEIVRTSVADAIAVPETAVRERDGAPHVWVVGADGATEARAVKLGERAEGRVRILEGLAAGETVLVKAPEAQKTEKTEKAEEAQKAPKPKHEGEPKDGDEGQDEDAGEGAKEAASKEKDAPAPAGTSAGGAR